MKNLDYGIVGNCKSAALISREGAIEWMCMPDFNSSSVFAKILDKKIGGSFEIFVDESYTSVQRYIPKTNILVTKFSGPEGSFEMLDFMPRYLRSEKHYYAPPDIIRYFKVLDGCPKFRLKYDPKLEYSAFPMKTIIEKEFIKSHTTKGTYDSMYLYTSFNKEKILQQEEIVLENDGYCLVSYNQKILPQNTERCYLKLQRTKVYWLNWAERTQKFPKYNDEILRSALVLKLLSYDKSGAILAAATTSLPETIGEVRNWDYRYCWVRDASMAIKIMSSLGHMNVTRRFLDFVINIIPDKDEKIQIMYGINGEKKLTEKILNHLSGYENSAPVRIGNAAYKQKQNDIYGVLMDVIYQQFKLFETTLENSEALWTITRSIVRIVEKNWSKPDRGIWEFRTEQKHFTFSKVLCWVAIDRAIKVGDLIRKSEYTTEWCKLRDKIRKDIMKKAWNENMQAFTQSYGSDQLDAANLLMEAYGFLDGKDPKYISTVRASQKLLSNNGLMYRYRNKDDFGEPSSSFTICTFWLINSLVKIGEVETAVKLFNKVLSYSNHLGLFSEDLDFESKRLLGNFPQAYSHLALIETAINISNGSKQRNEIPDSICY